MPQISVIVPVYQAEKYLDALVQSVRAQTFADWELLLVDDGSTDTSAQQCDAWAQKDGRIVVFHQANAGQGVARNAGIAAAGGEYLLFADSDDLLCRTMLETLYAAVQRQKADFARCRFARFFGDGPTKLHPEEEPEGVLPDRQAVLQTLALPMLGAAAGKTPICGTACTTLYRAEIVHKAKAHFPSAQKMQSEDLLFNLQFLCATQCGVMLPEVLYYYRMQMQSFSHTVSRQTLEAMLRLDVELQCLGAQMTQDTADLAHRVDARLLDGVSVCAKNAALLPLRQQALAELKQMADIPRVRQALNSSAGHDRPFPLSLFCKLLRYGQYSMLRTLVKIYTAVGR